MFLCNGRKYPDDFILEGRYMEKAVISAVNAVMSSLPKDARRYDVIKDVLAQAKDCLDRIPLEFKITDNE